MKLSWHDAVATLLVAIAAGLYWAFIADAGLPLVSALMVFVLVTGSTGALAGLTALVVGLWLVTTVRRLVTSLRTPRHTSTLAR